MGAPSYVDFAVRHAGLDKRIEEGEAGQAQRDLVVEEMEEAYDDLFAGYWKESKRRRGAMLQGAHRLALRLDVAGVEDRREGEDGEGEEMPDALSVGNWSEGYARAARSSSLRMSRAAQTAPGSDAWWGLTRWGMEWLQLQADVRSTIQFDWII